MNREGRAAARAEARKIIRDAWAIHAKTGDPRDAEQARVIEAAARDLLAGIAKPAKKQSHAVRKRKAFKHCVPISADAPLLAQAQAIGK